jgi:hypothetical protein
VNGTVTARQYVALRFYYVEGWSQRRIADLLGIQQQSVHRLICRGQRWIIDAAASDGGVKSLRLRALLVPSPSASATREASWAAASRQDELLDALDLRLQERASELDSIEACMSGDSCLLTHCKRNCFDRWEMDVLNARDKATLSTCDYEARRLLRYVSDQS